MTLPQAGSERFIVTEVEGFGTSRAAGNAPMGLSVHVVDSAVSYRMMATFRSEDYTNTPMLPSTAARREYTRARVRRMARERADQLNADPAAGILGQLQLSA
jgi:hypothetical protein